MALLARLGRSQARQLARALNAEPAALRGFSSAPEAQAAPADDADIVLETFKEQQKAYRDVLEGMKTIQVPLSLQPEAVKKYANEMEALKKKAGIPEQEDLIRPALNHQFEVANGDIRKFMQDAVSLLNLGDKAEVTEYVNDLSLALTEVEQQHGTVADSEQAWKAFQSKVQEMAQKNNFTDLNAIKSQAIVDMYAEQLGEVKGEAEEEVETAKRRDTELEGLSVDVGAIKPSF